jgi:hypothetical protein
MVDDSFQARQLRESCIGLDVEERNRILGQIAAVVGCSLGSVRRALKATTA